MQILETYPALAAVLPELRATIGRARCQRPLGTLVRRAVGWSGVRTAFIGVFNFSMLYAMDREGGNTPSKEVDKTAERVKTNLTALQKAMRDRLE